MKTPFWLLSSTLTLAVLASCETSKPATDVSASAGSNTAATGARTSGESMESNGIRLTPFGDSPKFPEAQMQLRAPIANSTVPSGEVPFNYQITNFQLTKMSGGPHMAEMANSMKGQHIHNIVDNEPYTAHYETSFSKAIPDGQHVVLSFLSRSYHESLKHRGAYDLRVINVGNGAAPATPIINVNGPNLFYSRPKDTYSGADAKRIMLDFYLVNTTLEPGGNRVRATINGTEFMLDKWMPYMMEGLPAGENTVKLELVDSSGTLIPGPYNSVTRKFTVAP
ncbi:MULTISPECIES: hypothetical protein [Hymenobacter]|uniref:Phosphopeptide-binding protein n=1 Tax=Hymenobacter armeniacus TaxID=2771358 RepID=A0ABR8JYP4_9BACT|nr:MULTISPECIES: hypothetical protein [Hymenobacter]MBD2723760.1 hypothetical protein [Hymenobacter armeniacus]MBJ6107832.1 hypothetical protein [Hymenobacter sp. BT523]